MPLNHLLGSAAVSGSGAEMTQFQWMAPVMPPRADLVQLQWLDGKEPPKLHKAKAFLPQRT
jgi:hypothetical protein